LYVQTIAPDVRHGVSSSQEFQKQKNNILYMAPRRRLLRGNSVLVSVYDRKVGYLVFRFDVKRLFSDDDDDESRRRSRRRRRPREVLPLPPSHVACFRRPLSFPMDLAASPGARGQDRRRHHGRAHHGLRRHKVAVHRRPRPTLLEGLDHPAHHKQPPPPPPRRHVFSEPDPHFEAFRLTSGGRLHPIPVPPRLLFGDDEVDVTSYFVAGGRVWLSVRFQCDGVKKGT